MLVQVQGQISPFTFDGVIVTQRFRIQSMPPARCYSPVHNALNDIVFPSHLISMIHTLNKTSQQINSHIHLSYDRLQNEKMKKICKTIFIKRTIIYYGRNRLDAFVVQDEYIYSTTYIQSSKLIHPQDSNPSTDLYRNSHALQ